MPRIDPLQLLNCLSVLLKPNGGIKSTDEVQRLASLMTKFSKKLVSKCIYVQILRNTETGLLGRFMGGGGWNLAHQWLSDAILAQNLPFIKELLELLLMCPVDVERLKLNNCPKLIKNLTKEASNEEVRQLATRLVEQWLRIVKGQTAAGTEASMAAVSTAAVVVLEPMEVALVPSVIQEVTEIEQEEAAAVEPPSAPLEALQEPLVEPHVEPEDEALKDIVTQEVKELSEDSNDASAWDGPNGTLPVYKITIKDGKQMLSKVPTSERTPRKQSFDSSTLKHDVPKITTNIIVKRPSDPVPPVKRKLDSAANVPSVKSKSVKSESEKDIKKKVKDIRMKIQENAPSEKKIKLIEPSKDKPSEATNEKERVKERRERELNKLKEKKQEKAAAQLEKDKATLAKLVPPPISKLGKIPKKPRLEDGSKSSSDKKPSDEKKSPEHKRSPLSPDVKRSSTESNRGRPKTTGTVKLYNSKFRSTGLEEEAKPPKSSSSSSHRRLSSSSSSSTDKKVAAKRVSPNKDAAVPTEKKAKISEPVAEEPKKAEKLAPPKPKRLVIQESDMFMDALITSTKKEVRKRKRRVSTSKEGTTEVKKEKDDTPPSSPTVEDNLSPIVKPSPKFYRDTLETSETEKDDKAGVKDGQKVAVDAKSAEANINGSTSPSNEAENGGKDGDQVAVKGESGEEDEAKGEGSSNLPRGVLVHHKTRKGPKKSVRWKTEDLETIQFFELDETERVNVTKTFTDMKQMERTSERETFQLSRKLPQDDNMEEKTTWKFPTLIDVPKTEVVLGGKSKEKDVQYARETVVLSALYFNRASIPDTAAEPDPETHPARDPVIIPLEDTTGNPDTVSDYRAQGWPEPKPLLPPTSPSAAAAAVFPTHFVPYTGGAAGVPTGGPAFQNLPPVAVPYPPPGMMGSNGIGPGGPGGGDWRTGDGRVVAMDGSAMQMDMYSQQGGPAMGMGMGMPGVMGPPGGHMDMGYNMMGNPEEMSQYPMGPGYPMQGPPHMGPGPMGPGPPMQGPPMGFPPQFRGPMGPRGNRPPGRGGQWFRPNGAMGPGPHWRGGSRGWNRGICRQFSSRGNCRMGSSCGFTH